MTALSTVEQWFSSRRPRPQARIRLFCFPYAGGGASAFRGWAETLPTWVEVCPVQLPGRESRFAEPPFERLEPLVESLSVAVPSHLDRPYALFGHSLGALVAFELARRLARDGLPQPVRLFVSGCRAPQIPSRERSLHTLPDAELREELRGLNGTPTAILADDELMAVLLPTLRADFAICDTYAYTPSQPLTCPISAWSGLGDETVNIPDLLAWRYETTAAFQLHLVPGDHFFVHSARPVLLQAIARELRAAVAKPACRRTALSATANSQSRRRAGRAAIRAKLAGIVQAGAEDLP